MLSELEKRPVLVVEDLPANARDLDSIPGSGRSPREGNDNSLQYSCLGKSQEQRSLVGYSPWGCRESDMTEHSTHRESTGPRNPDVLKKTQGSFYQVIMLHFSVHQESRPICVLQNSIRKKFR